MDLTEAGDIKKRWQEYKELYKKDLHDPDNHDAVITQDTFFFFFLGLLVQSCCGEGGRDAANK